MCYALVMTFACIPRLAAQDSTRVAQDTTSVTQDTARAAHDRMLLQRGLWMNGGSVGLPAVGLDVGPELFTIGFHRTRVRFDHPGSDFSIGIMPRFLAEGLIAVGARAGLVLPLALSPNAVLLPSVGVSFVGAAGSHGGDGLAGLNAGVAALMLGEESAGVRVGITWHRLHELTVWLLEFGFMTPSGSER